MIKIDGVAMPTPAEFSVTIQDIDASAERNARGDLVRDKVATKRKISLKYQMLTQTQAATILRAVDKEFFSFTYPDPVAGEKTITAYTGDRQNTMKLYQNGAVLWSELPLSIIER